MEMSLEQMMPYICAGCMLCGIVLLGLEISFPESGGTFRFSIAIFFIIIGAWGIYQLERDKTRNEASRKI